MKLLEGKVAIVTGAGRPKGMGRASALKLAEQGASVVVTDLARKREDLMSEGLLGIGDEPASLEKLVTEIEALGHAAQPGEVADVVAYLAGPRSGYLTGVALPVAGGMPSGL